MKNGSKFPRLLFVSPWPLLLFFIIPLLFIVAVKLHVRLPLATSKYPLLLNNGLFCLFVGLRFLYYLRRMTSTIRYGADRDLPGKAADVGVPAGEIRNTLSAAGFRFDGTGCYGEKRDLGYVGTALFYAGLFIALFTGTLDNLRQFSGTVLHGVGASVDLNAQERYRALVTGPLTGKTSLPKMKIVRFLLPDATYPLGAAEVLFGNPDGKVREIILQPSEPYRVGGYEIHMAKMLYEPRISVVMDKTIPVYHGQVMLWPLAVKENDFGFYAPFVDGNLGGEIYYQPEKSRLKMFLREGSSTLLNHEYIFQVDRQQTSGNITFTVERMGVWAEVKVMRTRHMPLILFGGIVMLTGILVRVLVRPQRVWLEETPNGSRIRTVGSQAVGLLRSN